MRDNNIVDVSECLNKISIGGLLKYNESSFFENLKYDDSNPIEKRAYVVMYVPPLKRFWVVKPELYNGAWYGLNYKLTSVLTCSINDIIGLSSDLFTIAKAMDEDTLGVSWKSGIKYKALPNFWNNINKLVTI